MRKLIVLTGLLLLGIFCLNTNLYAQTLPAKGYGLKTDKKVNVPTPVLRAYQELLMDIADEHGILLSELSGLHADWTKEKNTYTVHAQSGGDVCGESGTSYTIVAKFKANGDVILISDFTGNMVPYLLHMISCIRLPI